MKSTLATALALILLSTGVSADATIDADLPPWLCKFIPMICR